MGGEKRGSRCHNKGRGWAVIRARYHNKGRGWVVNYWFDLLSMPLLTHPNVCMVTQTQTVVLAIQLNHCPTGWDVFKKVALRLSVCVCVCVCVCV